MLDVIPSQYFSTWLHCSFNSKAIQHQWKIIFSFKDLGWRGINHVIPAFIGTVFRFCPSEGGMISVEEVDDGNEFQLLWEILRLWKNFKDRPSWLSLPTVSAYKFIVGGIDPSPLLIRVAACMLLFTLSCPDMLAGIIRNKQKWFGVWLSGVFIQRVYITTALFEENRDS